jgi:hypothetical protein
MIELRQKSSWATVIGVCLLTLSLASNPRVAKAGPSEDALKECIENCPAIGALVHAAGCLAGYTIFGATVDGTYPKFDFAQKTGFPSTPLGRDTLYYTSGVREVLSVGLWKGCPPECTTGVTLVIGPEDVGRVTFSITSLDQLIAAETFDGTNWTRLGRGGFNRAKNAWELDWDTSIYNSENGYVIRADFNRGSGKTQVGVGLAVQE